MLLATDVSLEAVINRLGATPAGRPDVAAATAEPPPRWKTATAELMAAANAEPRVSLTAQRCRPHGSLPAGAEPSALIKAEPQTPARPQGSFLVVGVTGKTSSWRGCPTGWSSAVPLLTATRAKGATSTGVALTLRQSHLPR